MFGDTVDTGDNMKTVFIVLDILLATGVLLFILTGLPKIINYIIGIFGGRQKPLPKAQNLHKFAVIIPARNESSVIGDLLSCIQAQTLSKEAYDVYIAVESLDDPTCAIARDFGAEIYVKRNFDKNGKGYVLEEVVDHIFQNRADRGYEAFIIIDADNLLEPDYFEKLNDALDAGYDIAVGYRNSKNWNDGWIAANTGLTFTRFSRFVNYPRSRRGDTVLLTGTCYYIKTDIVKKYGGWQWHSLTEDVELTTVSAINGFKTRYIEDAVFYDEQPTDLKTSFIQRKRWVKGFFDNGKRFNERLYQGAVYGGKSDRRTCAEMLFGAACMASFAVFFAAYIIGNLFIMVKFFDTPIAFAALYRFIGAWAGYFVALYIDSLIILIKERKRIKMSFLRKAEAVIMRPVYSMLYVPVAILALLSPVEWTPIEHKVNVVDGKTDKK